MMNPPYGTPPCPEQKQGAKRKIDSVPVERGKKRARIQTSALKEDREREQAKPRCFVSDLNTAVGRYRPEFVSMSRKAALGSG